MADKKLIATTVSSREKGKRRREEGETTSSQRKISAQGNQDECKKNHMKPEDESPTQRSNRKNDNDEEAERMEDMRSKGGGRLKHCVVDGDVLLGGVAFLLLLRVWVHSSSRRFGWWCPSPHPLLGWCCLHPSFFG